MASIKHAFGVLFSFLRHMPCNTHSWRILAQHSTVLTVGTLNLAAMPNTYTADAAESSHVECMKAGSIVYAGHHQHVQLNEIAHDKKAAMVMHAVKQSAHD
jgi:hypothetical protein